MTTTTGNCNIDLVICMDQSESIDPDQYVQLQNFVVDILRSFPDLGPNQNQVSVLAFDNIVDELFALNTYTNVEDAVDSVEDHTQGAGTTRIDLCIQLSTTVSGLRNRNLFPRILIVITDGRSSDGSSVREAVRASDIAGFFRIAVGIGADVDEQELRTIAGNNIFLVDDFNSLSRLTDEIVDMFCTSTSAPTRTPGTSFSGQTTFIPFPPFISSIQPSIINPTSCNFATCRPCPWNVQNFYRDNNLINYPKQNYHYKRLNRSSLNSLSKSYKDKCWPPDHDGPKWVLIARQSAGYYFRPYELTVNPSDPTAKNYSILSDLERYRANNSMFTFRLLYPCNNIQNIWMQNNNPAIERSGVCCYKPLSIEDDKLGWNGLKFNGRTALMDGSKYGSDNYYSVGSFFEFFGGIKGFLPAKGIKMVELYVLPPNENITICKPPPDVPGTRKNLNKRAIEGTIVTYECECGYFGCSGQCYQDAICLPSGVGQIDYDDRNCGVEIGEWIGVPREGDCTVGSLKDIKKKQCEEKCKRICKEKCCDISDCMECNKLYKRGSKKKRRWNSSDKNSSIYS